MDQKLEEAVLAKAEIINDCKYLACRDAFELATRFDVKPAVIGKICNANQVKLKSCQLGCF